MENCTQPEMIRRRREILGISLTAFARRVGMSRRTYSDIEGGKRRIKPDEVLSLLAALELIDMGKIYSINELVPAARGIFSKEEVTSAMDHTMAPAA